MRTGLWPLPPPKTIGKGDASGSSGGVPLVLLIEDSFTDADSTLLTAHAIAPTNTPAVSWVNHVGANAILGNKVGAWSGVVTENLSTVDSGIANGIVEALITHNAGSARAQSVIVRFLDSSNYWKVELTTTAFRIRDVVAGVETTRVSTFFSAVGGVSYTIRVTMSGDTISATRDGLNPISYASASFNNTQTKHGIRMVTAADFTGLTMAADDFKVYS